MTKTISWSTHCKTSICIELRTNQKIKKEREVNTGPLCRVCNELSIAEGLKLIAERRHPSNFRELYDGVKQPTEKCRSVIEQKEADCPRRIGCKIGLWVTFLFNVIMETTSLLY